MLSKPCARSDRGCLRQVYATHGPKTFAITRYCSSACGMKARREAGWVPTMTPEAYRRSGQIGGQRSARIRQEKARLKAAAEMRQLVPAAFWASLDAQQRAMVLLLMGRAAKRFYRLGRAKRHRIQQKAAA